MSGPASSELPCAPVEADDFCPPLEAARRQRCCIRHVTRVRERTVFILVALTLTKESPVNPLGKRRFQRNSVAIATADPVDQLATSAGNSLVSLGSLALAGGSHRGDLAALVR
jgi:hypothetical protein